MSGMPGGTGRDSVDAGSATQLERGRQAFTRQGWMDAYQALSAADREQPLGPEDLERLGTAAYLAGGRDESFDIWSRAHNEFLRRGGPGDRERAARWACWLAFRLLIQGEPSRGGGWLARGSRLIEPCEPDCRERGYLLLPLAMRCALTGDAVGAREQFHLAAAIGDRFGDRDLVAMARMGEGRSLIRLGQANDGLALLDEAMAGVDAREVSPNLVGDLYCSVISACGEVFDLRRAQEWTAALSHWCDSQPEVAPHRGECLVRRAEIMRFHGAWPEALAEARRATALLVGSPGRDPAAGAALYETAELYRLRGEIQEAEAAYRAASIAGRTPQPGLALLRLAQGQTTAALAGIRQALDEAGGGARLATMLAAAVDIALAAADPGAARQAADRLREIASRVEAPYLRALSATACGAVLLAEGDARAAREELREARSLWQELEAPYEMARTRMLLGRTSAELGDADSAELELDAARAGFERLRAAPDLARLEAVRTGGSRGQAESGLSARELEVLALIAEGLTNRTIADRLFISEKTVARHVSNIFEKLGLSTRSAAAAYAHRHGLLQGRG